MFVDAGGPAKPALVRYHVAMASVTNINDVLDGHVALEVHCVDRLYLNAYVPNLQVGGQVVTFLTQHLGFPLPSPALLEKIGNRFRREVKAFAADNGISILHLKKPDRTRWDDRKLDHVRPYLDAAERDGRHGVVAIVQSQEFQWVFSAKKRVHKSGVVSFDFDKEDRRVGMYYFYINDAEFGPGFIKICTYFPYPAKVWLNGHEWAKRQARRAGIAFTELANGFATCADPVRLQQICDRFGSSDVEGFFDRWTSVIPTPFTDADRRAGYFYELSMRQVEVSRTLVFDDPRRARSFFESLVTDNIGIGRPHEVHAVFGRDRRGRTTAKPFQTRVFSPGTEVHLDFSYKHSRIKQYLILCSHGPKTPFHQGAFVGDMSFTQAHPCQFAARRSPWSLATCSRSRRFSSRRRVTSSAAAASRHCRDSSEARWADGGRAEVPRACRSLRRRWISVRSIGSRYSHARETEAVSATV